MSIIYQEAEQLYPAFKISSYVLRITKINI